MAEDSDHGSIGWGDCVREVSRKKGNLHLQVKVNETFSFSSRKLILLYLLVISCLLPAAVVSLLTPSARVVFSFLRQ